MIEEIDSLKVQLKWLTSEWVELPMDNYFDTFDYEDRKMYTQKIHKAIHIPTRLLVPRR